MRGEKFYFGAVMLVKGTIKKNIVQEKCNQAFVNFVNKAFLSHIGKMYSCCFVYLCYLTNINLPKIKNIENRIKKAESKTFLAKKPNKGR